MARLRSLGSLPTRLALLAVVGWLALSALMYPDFTRVHGDGYYTYLWARSIVFDGDLDFHEDYRTCPDPWGMAHMPHGDDWNQWNPGPALFWIPFLVWDRVTGYPSLEDGSDHERNGCMGVVPDRAVRGSFVAGLLMVLCAYLAARKHWGEGPALFGVVVACLLSPIAFYAALLWSYGHAISAATSGLVVWLWLKERARPTRYGWIWMGLAMGVAMLARPQNGIVVLLPLSYWLATARRHVEQQDRGALARHVGWGFAYVAVILTVFAPQIWFWWDSTGELFLVPQSEHYMRWSSPRLMQTLWSTQAGLFTWSPALYLSFAGIVWMAIKKESRGIGIPILLLVVIHTYVAAAVFDWWGGTSFPGRRFDTLIVPFAMGAAAIASEIYQRGRARPQQLAFALTSLFMLGGLLWTSGAESAALSGAIVHAPDRADHVWTRNWERTSGPVWQAVGNPLAWPASIPFAIRYGLHPRAWDVAGAPELFFHHWLTMEGAGFEWRFDAIGAHAELVSGFVETPISIDGRRVRMSTGEYAHGVIPMGWPELGALELEVAVPPTDADGVDLWVSLGDEDLGSHHLGPGTTDLRIEASGSVPHDGMQRLRFRVLGGAFGLRAIDLLDPSPSPAERQREINVRALARRRAWRLARHPDQAE
jgi:hypothetical protein